MSSLPRLLHVCTNFLFHVCICIAICDMSNSEYFQGLSFTLVDSWVEVVEEAHIICRFTWRKFPLNIN